MRLLLFIIISALMANETFCQSLKTSSDTTGMQTTSSINDASKENTTTVLINDSLQISYQRPKGYHFITNLPNDWYEFGKRTISKKGLITVGAIAASTAILIAIDRPAIDAVQQFGRWSGISGERKFANAIKFSIGNTKVNFLDLPQNLNSTLYFIGEGWPTIAFTSGLLTYGLISNDNRAILTASQVAEGYIAMGVTVQLIKRITGRQSPFKADGGTGNWHLFPSMSRYQSNVPNYDAFPSGHMATLMATVTIYAENYPEYKWIRPAGYTVMGLVGLAMMNNGVHWLSDYPLAIAIGYTYGKIVTSRGKSISFIRKMGPGKDKGNITFSPAIVGYNGIGMAIKLTL